MTFEPGTRVRVRSSGKPGHVRPERLLYKVGFRQADLWSDYEGPDDDRLYADVYEHWLEPDEGEPA